MKRDLIESAMARFDLSAADWETLHPAIQRKLAQFQPKVIVYIDGGLMAGAYGNMPVDVTLIDMDNIKSEDRTGLKEKRAEARIRNASKWPWRELPF